MPAKLPRAMSQLQMKGLLIRHGWQEERGGKHAVKMTKEGHRPITLPQHKGKDYHVGLTQRILKEAGLKDSAEDQGSGHE